MLGKVGFEKTGEKIKHVFNNDSFNINVIPGFICKNENGDLSTLGRGGSDLSASIIANVLNAKSLEIWTDVSGVYTANPKIVSQARPIKNISYHEMSGKIFIESSDGSKLNIKSKLLLGMKPPDDIIDRE